MDEVNRRQGLCTLGTWKGLEMSKLINIIEGIGVVMLWVGCSAMDSVSLVAPITIIGAGIALMWAGASMEARG